MTAATIAAVETCTVCGIVLGAGEHKNAEQAQKRRADVTGSRAIEEERAGVERNLTQFRGRRETAIALKDEPGRVELDYRIGHAEERLEHIDAVLAGNAVELLPDGPCAGCGVVYSGGYVDHVSLRNHDRDRRERLSKLAALEEDLASATARAKSETVTVKQLEQAGDRASLRAADDHRERAEHAADRVVEIERAIANVRGDLVTSAAPPAARAERRGKLSRVRAR